MLFLPISAFTQDVSNFGPKIELYSAPDWPVARCFLLKECLDQPKKQSRRKPSVKATVH